jgi:hypothetical protein
MRKILIYTLLSMLVIACVNRRNKMAEQIRAMEMNNGENNDAYLDSISTLYEKFANAYPEDSLSPGYLLKAGNNAHNRADADPKFADIALARYQRIIKDYNSKKEASTALFMIGSIYENEKKDTVAARIYYTRYLEKYPQGEYATDINQILNGNLGKSAEEIYENLIKSGKLDTSGTHQTKH